VNVFAAGSFNADAAEETIPPKIAPKRATVKVPEIINVRRVRRFALEGRLPIPERID
jgi:hypothetical protein